MQNLYLRTFLAIFLLFALQSSNAQNVRPKIGLTLSGGGAKGLVHIGLLKAIDSVGLKIDYVTGTSMGTIVGGLYAVGYTGDEILAISKTLDWSSLMSNNPPLSTLNLKEKQEFAHYLHLPLIKGKPALRRGLIESNELWLKLSELYYPYYEINDFSKFERGFQCIAADIVTGEMVVLKKGNIVKAVRASMAIPSVFTPVEIDGKLLVDGGIIRNFPVANVKNMGADIVIGSDVSSNLPPVDEIQSPVDVFSQLIFFSAAKDLEEQKKLVDLYVDYPLGDNGAGNFSSAQEIIKIGLQKGKELYPTIKRLKDSLDLIYGPEIPVKNIQKRDSVFISNYEITGLDDNEKPAFVDLINFIPNSYYTAHELSTAIRSAISTRTFTKINYSLTPLRPGEAKIIFEVNKAPSTFARFGFHYDTATGIGLKVGFVKKGFLLPFSTTSFDVSIGENPRAKFGYDFYLTKNRELSMELEATVETIDINSYNPEFISTGLYNQVSQKTDLKILWQPENNWEFGMGTNLGYVAIEPKIISRIQANGNLRYLNTYVFLHHNTLNTMLYPNRGSNIYIKAGVVYNQKVDFTIYQNGTNEAGNLSSNPYTQLKVNFEKYFPIKKSAFFIQLQSGMNFNYKQTIMNDYVIGGLNDVIRNQITFAGLPEASIFTGSAISLKLGYQLALTKDLFLIAKANGLYYDFVTSNYRLSSIPTKGIGYSLTAGYRTFLGPIEASLMYSDFNKKILPYFNLGYILNLN